MQFILELYRGADCLHHLELGANVPAVPNVGEGVQVMTDDTVESWEVTERRFIIGPKYETFTVLLNCAPDSHRGKWRTPRQ